MPSCAIATVLFAALLLAGSSASAQDTVPEVKPIGRFAADVRGAFPKFKQNPAISSAIGVTTANLPTRSLGLVFGAHWYPARMGVVTFGFGGELLVARAGRTLPAATKGGEDGPTVRTRFSSVSPQVSFNFGSREGWSYISGGIGWSKFTTEKEASPLPDQLSRSKTINYGGGARWFSKRHIAMSVDLRFYAVNPQEAAAPRPAYPRMTLMVMSVGAAFK